MTQADGIQVAGGATVAAALAFWHPIVGAVALGVFMLLFGVAMERD